MLTNRKDFTLQNRKTQIDVPRGSNEPSAFELVSVQYGDVTGDGTEDAVITVKMEVMGNSNPYVVFIYSLTNGEPKMLWAHETGDRADQGLRNVYVNDDGLLVIEEYNAEKLSSGTGEEMPMGMCCPKTFTRAFYKWDEGQFLKVKKETQPNNYKDSRVLIRSQERE